MLNVCEKDQRTLSIITQLFRTFVTVQGLYNFPIATEVEVPERYTRYRIRVYNKRSHVRRIKLLHYIQAVDTMIQNLPNE